MTNTQEARGGQKYNLNIDIVKIIALCGVPAIHFFLYNGLLTTALSTNLLPQVIVRQAMSFCVPLFLLATGFLMSRKEISGRYYKGIIYILFVYIITSLVWIVFERFFLHADISFLHAVKSIIFFHGSPYAGYVGMYVGLFLLIPFLNVIYNNISKKQKLGLCLTLTIVSIIPSAHNYIGSPVLPWAFWVGLWPIAYYFIGAYLREFNLKILKRQKIALIIVLLAALVLAVYIFAPLGGGKFLPWTSDWGQPLVVAYSVLLFSLLLDISTARVKPGVGKTVSYIASLTLGAYLLSAIFDKLIYGVVLSGANIGLRYYFIPLVVLAASVLLASAIDGVYKFLKINPRSRGVGAQKSVKK